MGGSSECSPYSDGLPETMSSTGSGAKFIETLGHGGAGMRSGDLHSPRVPASASEEGTDEMPDAGDGADQSERILRQMRKCVLVHHQLSCLLIHQAAMEAGIYNGDGAATELVTPRGEHMQLMDGGGDAAAVKHSINRLGGSTTRLFSVALRDRHDLESMGDTLQQRVADMVQNTRGEFALAGYDAECQLAALAALEQTRSEYNSLNSPRDDGEDFIMTARSSATANGCDGPGASCEESGGQDAEAEQLAEECRQLAADLAAQQVGIAKLTAELDETQASMAADDEAVATACFEEVGRATERNRELEDILLRLRTDAAAAADAEERRWQQPADTHGTAADDVDIQSATYDNCSYVGGGALQRVSSVDDGQHCNDVTQQPPSPTFGRGSDAHEEADRNDQFYRRAGDYGHIGTRVDNGASNVQYLYDVTKAVGAVQEELFDHSPQSVSYRTERPVSFGRPSSHAEASGYSSPESIARLDAQLRQSQSEFYGM